jgi:hypothetical protein
MLLNKVCHKQINLIYLTIGNNLVTIYKAT